MSLNLYAGSLQRFYRRNFERPAERYARKQGFKYTLITPGNNTAFSKDEAQEHIKEMKIFLAEKATFTSIWNEDFASYYTEELTYQGHSALYYVAAMVGLNRPIQPKNASEIETFSLKSIGLDRQQCADSPAIVFEADIIYPGGESNMAIFIAENGEQLIVPNLDWLYAILLQIEDVVWPGAVDINKWLQRGPLAENDVKDIDDYITQNAQYAFAVYRSTLDFALKNNVPIVLDM